MSFFVCSTPTCHWLEVTGGTHEHFKCTITSCCQLPKSNQNYGVIAQKLLTVLLQLYIENQKHIPNFSYINNFPFGGLSKTNVLFCKSSLSKMASIKTNKNKNQTSLMKTNFSWLKTFVLGPKRFLHSKGPKNAICLFNEENWDFFKRTCGNIYK